VVKIPADVEIILGWSLKDYCRLFNFPYPKTTDYDGYWKIIESPQFRALDKALIQAHLNVLLKSGIIKGKYKYKEDYLLAQTKKGIREFSTFHLGNYGDEGETNDTFPETYVIGVHLSSRYFPTYIDWEDPNGTISHFDYETMKPLIDLAKQELIKVDKRFQEAHLFVKLIWY